VDRQAHQARRGRASPDRTRRFIDDHPPVANARHAAIVRSPHAHARILGYDTAAALATPGVSA